MLTKHISQKLTLKLLMVAVLVTSFILPSLVSASHVLSPEDDPCVPEREQRVREAESTIAKIKPEIARLEGEFAAATRHVEAIVSAETQARTRWESAERQHRERSLAVVAAYASRNAAQITSANQAYAAAKSELEASGAAYLSLASERISAWWAFERARGDLYVAESTQAGAENRIATAFCPSDFPSREYHPDGY